jgi:thiamine biosynthesis protein ThiI
MDSSAPPVLSVSCSEISLKGRNRPRFEALLMRNMRAALKPYGAFELRERGGRILAISKKDFDADAAKLALSRVFGIDYASLAMMVEPEIGKMEALARSISARFAGKSIRVETKRSDKRFPMTSQEASRRLGAVFVDAGASVDLKNPEHTIYVDILGDAALMSFDKQKGPAGMPVGSSGKVLSLLSGGIDSPVASWLMMKRGCTVDMLHVHSSPRNADVHDSKILRLGKKIREYSPCGMRLTIAPYEEFYKKAFKIDHRYEVIVFRRFLFRLASAIARRDGALGIVTGDSIAQVASQTVENIHATDEAALMPVFRPLVTCNKQETIDVARRIGTYEISLESYKDCCSLISSSSPSTNVPIGLARSLEEEIDMAGIVERTLEKSEAIEL